MSSAPKPLLGEIFVFFNFLMSTEYYPFFKYITPEGIKI